jgi:hypothetical protein
VAVAPATLRIALQGENRALVKANLQLVTQAEIELRRALDDEPDAVYLQSLLAAAEQQRRDLRQLLSQSGA